MKTNWSAAEEEAYQSLPMRLAKNQRNRMNYNKLYTKSIGAETPEAPVVPKDIKLVAQHATWLQHPQTQEFLNTLSREYDTLRDRATNLACTNPGSSDIIKSLISAKQLEKILSYARTNNQPD